ncbi:unnamed protein product [Adineta steineri]|uniref:Uncharacterized protein n=1 Tax=Adineta steineri TaxID=433720 RepID=A0A815GX78_9BILA|nr:unnamed protein product [Adineta steineri]CAF4056656.1 unnamed protein product [Adineta steineri]
MEKVVDVVPTVLSDGVVRVRTDSCVDSTQGCRPSVRRWGALTLGGLIGVIIGSVCGCCILVALIAFICKKIF